jgi:hypothetical protein
MLFMVEESVRSATLKEVLTTNHLPLLTPTA